MRNALTVLTALAAGGISIPATATSIIEANYSTVDVNSNYNASTGVLTWHSDSDTRGEGGVAGGGLYGSWNLIAHFDSEGTLIDGLFTLSDASTLFYAGSVIAYDLTIRDSSACPTDHYVPFCPPGTQQGSFFETVKLHDIYVNPVFTFWGNSTAATTYTFTGSFGYPPFEGSVFSRDELFRLGWTGFNYIQSHMTTYVPEPGTLTLFIFGLAGLGTTRRFKS